MRSFLYRIARRIAFRAAALPVSASVVAVVLVCLVCAPSVGLSTEPAVVDSLPIPSLDEILIGYNANIDSAMTAIETLRVSQEMVEPDGDGGEKRALAELTYTREEGMHRDEFSSNLGHPVGEYGLRSLVGPEIHQSEYDVALDGIEDMEGRRCYRLSVTAIERDRDHFDGTVWVEVGSLGLVRIVGDVADPPYPVQRIKLDKAFEPVPAGFRLLRRHTGEVDIKLALISRHGLMHIFYTDYAIAVSP